MQALTAMNHAEIVGIRCDDSAELHCNESRQIVRIDRDELRLNCKHSLQWIALHLQAFAATNHAEIASIDHDESRQNQLQAFPYEHQNKQIAQPPRSIRMDQ